MFDPPNPLVTKDGEPFLSILLPAYRYREGVHRVLSLLQPLPFADCELIVLDDSPDDEIEQDVVRWCSATGMQVAYQHNRPALGAAANWNALLNKARGKYCLLLHHDEFPLSNHFVINLIQELRKDPDVDVIMLDCVLIDPQNGRCRRHLPTWLRTFVVSRFPQYLFRRNVIGPTSSLVIRRTLYPRFDVRLRWLIDVDVYVRLLKVAKCLRMCPQIKVGSILGRTDSITTGLGSSIPRIAREERAYLEGVYHTTSPWLGPVHNEPILHSMLRACEAMCWNLMRGLTRITAAFCVGPVPRSMVQKAMKTPPGP
jgi:glycosyltransferase involved in cell wall biosynthesis